MTDLPHDNLPDPHDLYTPQEAFNPHDDAPTPTLVLPHSAEFTALSDALSTKDWGQVLQAEKRLWVAHGLTREGVAQLATHGVAAVIDLAPADALAFDMAVAVREAGLAYHTVPVRDINDLKQTVIMRFDRALMAHADDLVLLHGITADDAGAVVALRAGWLRGRKMDTALARGQAAGLDRLYDTVYQRLLVPR